MADDEITVAPAEEWDAHRSQPPHASQQPGGLAVLSRAWWRGVAARGGNLWAWGVFWGLQTERRIGRWGKAVCAFLLRSPVLVGVDIIDYIYEVCVVETFLQHSLVGVGPFFSPQLFPELDIISDNWKMISDEVEAVRRSAKLPLLQHVEPSQMWEPGGNWETLLLRIYHMDIEENFKRLPGLRKLVSGRRDIPTVMISVLKAGGHIQPHYGYYNGVLRYHLGLRVPSLPDFPKRLGIRVGSEWSTWREGTAIMFDDCYEHEVFNEAEEERIVLFLDIMRPLKWWPRLLNELLVRLMRFHPTVLTYERNAPLAKHQYE